MPSNINNILEAIEDGRNPISLNGLCGSALSYVLAKVQAASPRRSVFVISSSPERAQNFLDDISAFSKTEQLKRLSLFPTPDILPYSQLSPEPRLWADRMHILYRLAHCEAMTLIAPITACLRRLPPKIFIANFARVLRVGTELDRDDLTTWLTEMGYADTGLVEDEGEFAIRGFILDLWTPTLEEPVRIELEGDKIISIRLFDPATQRSRGEKIEVTLIPVQDIPFSKENCKIAINTVSRLAEETDFPVGEKRRIIEMINEGVAFAGIESFMPFFHAATSLLSNYLPPETLIIIDDPDAASQVARKHHDSISDLARHTTSVERLVPTERLLVSYDEWNKDISRFQQLRINELTVGELSLEPLVAQTFSNTDLRSRMDSHSKEEDPLTPIIQLLKDRQSQGEHIVLTCHTKAQAERLTDLFRWNGLSLNQFDAPFDTIKELTSATFLLRLARLSAGFHWPNEQLSIITDEELFGSKLKRKPKARPPIEHFTSFSELADGDYLVHELHGIGRYSGLRNLSIQDINNDFIVLEYLGGDKLYLPVYRLNLLQRYVGPGDAPPFLDKLGGTRWSKAQKKARHDILTIAKELLKIYAEREVHSGYRFPPSDTSYEEFAASFPYDETPDQERAIDEILRDMEIERPMDRLICGDVGYGKTEVAMRAAFKAAMAGKQSAVLVPTTLLALQHFENFTTRFEKTPIKVEMLSRFRSAKEQLAITEELKRGTVDIIIGTHRLLQKDVSYRDLGLLIIDEEQRFGVSHKERIRKLRSTVDCLTLTATPIPRTLHLSLTGIRDISVIDTPPVDRLSISTHIVPFDDGVIRHAILSELERGGQIFFVHNRVQTISSMGEHLSKLVPEASIAIAHGQMREHELEKVMHRFLTKEHNVLLTTSIIESGLDIPSANTIIVNRSDTFGLAQLYQIRGRVGRSNIRAYAYLLIPADGGISEIAKKRLTVLQRFTELGSGFQIAMHDLEIRGSGNILGRAQSGHVAAIGYEMYTKLLNREIRKLQGKTISSEVDPELNLSISAFFPESYITDAGPRIDLYRRLATRETLEEVDEIRQEITDRFGALPLESQNLIGVMEVKVLAKELKVSQLSFDGKMFMCRIDRSSSIDPAKLSQFVAKESNRYRLRPPDRILCATTAPEGPKDVLNQAKNFLSVLQSCVSRATQ